MPPHNELLVLVVLGDAETSPSASLSTVCDSDGAYSDDMAVVYTVVLVCTAAVADTVGVRPTQTAGASHHI